MHVKNGCKDLKRYPQISRRVRDTLARRLLIDCRQPCLDWVGGWDCNSTGLASTLFASILCFDTFSSSTLWFRHLLHADRPIAVRDPFHPAGQCFEVALHSAAARPPYRMAAAGQPERDRYISTLSFLLPPVSSSFPLSCRLPSLIASSCRHCRGLLHSPLILVGVPVGKWRG